MECLSKLCFFTPPVFSNRLSKLISPVYMKRSITSFASHKSTGILQKTTSPMYCWTRILLPRMSCLPQPYHVAYLGKYASRNNYSDYICNRRTQTYMRNNCFPYVNIYRTINGKKDEQVNEKGLLSEGALACRLANENGYLSWCRNSYLLTAVSLAMLFQGHNQATDLAGYVCLAIAGFNMGWGTFTFVYHIMAHRKRFLMSMPVALFVVAAAVAHALLYLAVLIVYSGNCDPDLMIHRQVNLNNDKEVTVFDDV